MLVVLEWDTLPLDAFLFVLLLLQGEHVLVELLLQLLVGIVNAELFEGVLCKDLESKDIQDADKCQLALLALLGAGRLGFCTTSVERDRRIDFLDDPAENSAVKVLAEGVFGLVGLVYC